MLGRRPIETSTCSASIVSAAPPLAGSTVSVTPFALGLRPPVTLVEPELEALLLEDLVGFLAHVAVEAGQDLVEKFDHRDLGAEPPPHRAELEPDHAAADHDQVLGHLRQLQRAGRIDDPLLVDLDARQRSDRRAGGDDDVLRAHRAVADLDRVRAFEARVALEPFDLVLLEQELDARRSGP